MAVVPSKKTSPEPVKADDVEPVKAPAPAKAEPVAAPVEPEPVVVPETPARSGYALAVGDWAREVSALVVDVQDDVADLRRSHHDLMQDNAPTPADGTAVLHVQRVVAAFDDLSRVLSQAAAVAASLTVAAS